MWHSVSQDLFSCVLTKNRAIRGTHFLVVLFSCVLTIKRFAVNSLEHYRNRAQQLLSNTHTKTTSSEIQRSRTPAIPRSLQKLQTSPPPLSTAVDATTTTTWKVPATSSKSAQSHLTLTNTSPHTHTHKQICQTHSTSRRSRRPKRSCTK